MTYYRVLCDLAFKNGTLHRGSIHRLKLSPDLINTHLRYGNISEVSTPPLNILPGWEDRAVKLKPLEVFTVADLFTVIEDDPEPLARLFEIDLSDVLQWRKELERDWLTVER